MVGPTSDFGSNKEIPVLADGGAGASVRADRGPILVRGFDRSAPQEFRRGDLNPERITLNDTNDPSRASFLPLADVRDRFTAPVRAVVDYNFGNYKFLVVNRPAARQRQPQARGHAQEEAGRARGRLLQRREPRRARPAGALRPRRRPDRRQPALTGHPQPRGDPGQRRRAGPRRRPDADVADVTYARLIAAIETAGGPTYDYRQVDPAPASDGGEPGGNIRVAFLFRTDNRDLRFVDRGTADATTPTEPVAGPGGRPQLTLSPGRVDPTNPVFNSSRKPLAAEFSYRGKPLFIVGNHFASKGGDDPVFGRFQEPRRPSELQRRGSATNGDTTRGQAGVVNTFVRKLLDIDSRARVLVLGDLNDFEFSETVKVLERGADQQGLELVDLWHFVPQDERYCYIFQGNGQVLDHILVSPCAAAAGPPGPRRRAHQRRVRRPGLRPRPADHSLWHAGQSGRSRGRPAPRRSRAPRAARSCRGCGRTA